MTHKIVLKEHGKPRTACGIKLDAFYPQSNQALPEGDDALIYATTDDRDVSGCVACVRFVKALASMKAQRK